MNVLFKTDIYQVNSSEYDTQKLSVQEVSQLCRTLWHFFHFSSPLCCWNALRPPLYVFGPSNKNSAGTSRQSFLHVVKTTKKAKEWQKWLKTTNNCPIALKRCLNTRKGQGPKGPGAIQIYTTSSQWARCKTCVQIKYCA